MALSPEVDQAVSRVVETYRRCNGVSFCYGQGSVLTGLTPESDLDIVMIWGIGFPGGQRARSRRSLTPVASLSSSTAPLAA